MTDSTTIFVVPHPELKGRNFLGYCPSNDLFRLLLTWVEAFPSWPFDMHLELSRKELRAKLEQNVTPGLHVGGAGEFVEQRWTYMSLSDDFDEPFLNWVHTNTRGDAVSWVNPSLRNIRRLISIQQDHDDPFWLRLVGTILRDRKSVV